jgi:uncharacterized membrane protein
MAMTATQAPPQRREEFPRQEHPLQTHAREGRTNVARLNVGETERVLSLIGGGLLGVTGLCRRSPGGLMLAGLGGGLVYRGLTGHCCCYEALGVSTARHSDQASIPAGQGARVDQSVTINKSPEELFQFWRRLENLPRFMTHVKSVKQTGGNRSHWVVEGPVGNVEWDALIITETPNEMIAWKSLEGSTVDTAGSVHFARAPGGTEVKVELKYNLPLGQVGAAVAWLLGQDPARQVREDLHRLKQLMESDGPSR